MAIIKSYSPFLNLSNYSTFIVDPKPTSEYFRISEFREALSGGKNGFLIEGSEYLKETTEIKIEILDVEGNPIYFEPGNGIPEYYEGISKLISVHVYDDTPIGVGKITILGELKNYIGQDGNVIPVPAEWKNTYNVKWEKTFTINKNLPNEDIVRFYKRPTISIDEIVKPIFSKVTPSVTQTGSLQGISQTPIDGSNLTNWRAGTIYKLKITDDSNFTSSIDENVINIPSLGYSPTVKEVLNNKEVLVDIPYSINNIVSNFDSVGYTSSFEYVEGQTVSDSSLTGSFAKINIQQLKTFVGDVARVKIYRKSRNEVGDFQFVQESKLEASELLRDVTTTSDTEVSYGNFTDSNLSTYWVSSSNDHPITIDVEKLNAAVKVDYNTTLGGVQKLITSESFSISKDVEYTITFKTLLSGSLDGSKTIKAYLSSSDYQQTFLTVSGSDIYKTRQTVSQNILATNTSDAKLVFEYEGGDWYVSNVSLQNAQETSFSPDEFVLIQDVPRKLASETFDYRFEFYDINNNYIPVDVLGSHTFTGGNNFPTNSRLLTFESDRTAFRFSTGSIQNPSNQQIKFTLSRNNLTGSVTYASSAFDTQGNFLNPNEYSKYPGELTSVTPAGAVLTINNFTGSRVDGFLSPFVGSIVYTASVDDLVEYETVYRLEDGENAPGLFVTSDANQFIYKATDLSANPSNQTITILAKRKNLASSITPIIVNGVGSVPSLTELGTNASTGITSYSLDIGDFNYSIPAPSASYYFTASDEWGNLQYDTITLSQVKVLDGLSVSLTNENATLPALSSGFVPSGSFVFTSGSVSVKVGSEDIAREEGLSTNNRWDIISATGTSCTPNDTTPDDATYGITSLSADSASLQLVVRYKDGGGDTTDVTKVVTYSKAKKSAPVLDFVIGNNNQATDATSIGTQISAFANSSLSVKEQYNGLTSTLTLVSAPTINSSSLFTPITKTTTNLSYPSMVSGTDSVELSITGSVVDSEGISRNVFGNVSLTKIKKAAPVLSISATPKDQSVTAKSTGEQVDSFSNVTISVKETYNGSTSNLTITSLTATSSDISSISTTAGTGLVTLNGKTLANGTNSTTVTISAVVTDSEGTSRTVTDTLSLSKVKKSVPNVVLSATPQSQTVSANPAGVQSGTLTNVSVTAVEGSTDRFTSMVIAGTSGFSTAPTVSGSTLTMTSAVMNSDEASVTLTVTHTDSEGTTGQTKTIIIRASKIKQGESGVVVNLNPASQVVTVSNTGVYGTPTSFVVSVIEGSTTYTYDASAPYSASSFRISGLSGGTNSNATITPTTPTSVSGTNVTFNIIYTNASGIEVTIPSSHKVTVTLDGQTGPGVVHTGPWESGRLYQFSTGAGTGRRDVVLYPASGAGTYYAATAQHTSTSTGVTGPPTVGAYWESLGSQDFFVAAKVGLFEDSYVQSTLNIGTNSTTGFSTANITLSGGTQYPYFSLGQASAGVYNADGIFIGAVNDSGTKYKLSLKGTGGSLLWDGNNLTVNGGGTFSGALSAASGTFAGQITVGSTNYNLSEALNANTTKTQVGLGDVSNLTPQSQAQTGLIAGTTITGGGITLSGGGNIKGGQSDYNTGTGFFLGYHGSAYKFSIGNASSKGITWDGATLSIGGDVNIGANLASALTTTTALNTGLGTKINTGAAATDVNNNVTNISGGKIRTGLIQSNNHSGTADGSGFSTAGMSIDLTGGGISAKNFRITSGGDAFFKGAITGGTIQIGSNFSVDTAGTISATNANLSGTVTATAGTIGGWSIQSGGLLQNSTGKLKINPDIPAIEIYDSSDVKRVNLHFGALSSLATGGNITFPATSLSSTYTQYTSGVYFKTYGAGVSVAVGTAGNYSGQVQWTGVSAAAYVYANGSYGAATTVGRGIEFRNSSGTVLGSIEGPSAEHYGSNTSNETLSMATVTETEGVSIPSAGTIYAYPYFWLEASGVQSGQYVDFNAKSYGIPAFTLTLLSSLVEISDAGIQIAKSNTQWIKFSRESDAHILLSQGIAKFTGIQAGYTMEIENAEVNGQGIGITVPSISTALYITAGNAYKPGGGTWLSTSDERLKKNIQDFTGSLELINQFRPRTFEWINPTDKGIGSNGTQIGFIAQEVEEVYPKWVNEITLQSGSSDIELIDSDFEDIGEFNRPKIKGIGFDNDFNTIVISAIQELSDKIGSLESKIVELESKISGSM